MDKGDLGTLVGAIAGGTLVAAIPGAGIPWIIAGSAIGAYGGHNLVASHYKPL